MHQLHFISIITTINYFLDTVRTKDAPAIARWRTFFQQFDWDPDCVMLVLLYMSCVRPPNLDDMKDEQINKFILRIEVEDGNTRLEAILTIERIELIPCRCIYVFQGLYLCNWCTNHILPTLTPFTTTTHLFGWCTNLYFIYR